MQVDRSSQLINKASGHCIHLERCKNSKPSQAHFEWKIKEMGMTSWFGVRRATYWPLWIGTTLRLFGTHCQASSSTRKCLRSTHRYTKLTNTGALITRHTTKIRPTSSSHVHRLSSTSRRKQEVRMINMTAAGSSKSNLT